MAPRSGKMLRGIRYRLTVRWPRKRSIGREPPEWYWSLPVSWLLALRYFRSTRKDASIRFLSSMTSGGIALGVSALVLAVAALSGFQARLLEQILARTPELQI